MHPREWYRPITKGAELMYDYALLYILRDAAVVKKGLEELQPERQWRRQSPRESGARRRWRR